MRNGGALVNKSGCGFVRFFVIKFCFALVTKMGDAFITSATMLDETREPRFERRAASARKSAREVVARARGQDCERRLRVDRSRALVRRECVERLEVACGCRAQSPVAAHDRDRLESLDERRARPLLGLARPHGLVRVEAYSASRARAAALLTMTSRPGDSLMRATTLTRARDARPLVLSFTSAEIKLTEMDKIDRIKNFRFQILSLKSVFPLFILSILSIPVNS